MRTRSYNTSKSLRCENSPCNKTEKHANSSPRLQPTFRALTCVAVGGLGPDYAQPYNRAMNKTKGFDKFLKLFPAQRLESGQRKMGGTPQHRLTAGVTFTLKSLNIRNGSHVIFL